MNRNYQIRENFEKQEANQFDVSDGVHVSQDERLQLSKPPEAFKPVPATGKTPSLNLGQVGRRDKGPRSCLL